MNDHAEIKVVSDVVSKKVSPEYPHSLLIDGVEVASYKTRKEASIVKEILVQQFNIFEDDSLTMIKKAQKLWELFGNIPITDDDKIDQPFLCFHIGEDRFIIWYWFEETFNVSISHLRRLKL